MAKSSVHSSRAPAFTSLHLSFEHNGSVPPGLDFLYGSRPTRHMGDIIIEKIIIVSAAKQNLIFVIKTRYLRLAYFLKKNLNASRLSEHPPVWRRKCQNV